MLNLAKFKFVGIHEAAIQQDKNSC